jgi:hypothetical protein
MTLRQIAVLVALAAGYAALGYYFVIPAIEMYRMLNPPRCP